MISFKKILLISLFFLALIIGCTKSEKEKLNYTKKNLNGIKIITNENRASNPNYIYKLNKILEIKSEDSEISDSLRYLSSINDVIFDKFENFYVLDSKKCSVKKFDKDGNYNKSFGSKGQGPGELQSISSIVLLDNFIYLSNANQREIAKFDLDGKFIKKTPLPGNFPPKLIRFANNKTIGSGTMAFVTQVDGEMKMKIKFFLTILDSVFKPINDIVKNTISCKMDDASKYLSSNLIISSTDHKEKIFLAKNSDSEYEISIYDITGKITSKIKKNYIKKRKIIEVEPTDKKDEKEDKLEEQITIALKKGDSKYYNSIDNIFYDGKGRLLVKTPLSKKEKLEGKKYFDLFIDGIFINRIKLDIDENKLLFFRSGKLISVNHNDNSFIIYEL